MQWIVMTSFANNPYVVIISISQFHSGWAICPPRFLANFHLTCIRDGKTRLENALTSKCLFNGFSRIMRSWPVECRVIRSLDVYRQ